MNKLNVQHKHSLAIKNLSQKVVLKLRGDILRDEKCEICGEHRAVNLCHIIPRGEKDSQDNEANYLLLCPTHHFLFDQAMLSQEEFLKISVDKKSTHSIKYFNEIHLRRHQMFWKYHTNKFEGCNCGSQSFSYDTDRNGNTVQICLKCNSCNEKWCNLWTERHPITEASIEAFPISTGMQNIENAIKLWEESNPAEKASSGAKDICKKINASEEEYYLAAEQILKEIVDSLNASLLQKPSSQINSPEN